MIAKPQTGSASSNVVTINTPTELHRVPADWLLQEKADGIELTTNLYLTQEGEVACAIPHRRIVVEGGEVAQARTTRNPDLIALCSKVARALPGAQGIINIQAFVSEATGQTQIIEINPRIGGGYPLCDAAKGRYIDWLCQELLDLEEVQPFEKWTDNLLMMRYRDAVFSL